MRAYVMLGLDPIAIEIGCEAKRVELEASRLEIEAPVSDAAIRESRVRILSALNVMGVFVSGSLTIESLPLGVSMAELDLALSLAVLEAIGEVTIPEGLYCRVAMGLDGSLRPVAGTYAALAKLPKLSCVVVAPENKSEADAAGMVFCESFRTLSEVAKYFPPKRGPGRYEISNVIAHDSALGKAFDESTIEAVKRAAAERRSITLLGRPGSGGTLLARFYRSQLTLSEEQAREVMAIHSVGSVLQSPLGVPFRAPHHSVSEAGLVGGGTSPRPGEVSLAHGGVLLLDEVQEFRLAALQAVRRVVSLGYSEISSGGSRRVRFPAAPCVVAVAPPCPRACREACRCTSAEKERYQERLSVVPTTERIVVQQPSVAQLVGAR
jgi:magnesium chelatase family protein